ncbi:amino acid permease-domain-containing protein [Obelidium mucronatum]|nr:amino acid permease-domain-containing protein [Obelidium mucronatum]
MDLFLGYCVGMLGVTGFETSSNYIEEQKPGVFPKTLRNMCILVFVCNPLLSVLSLSANSSTVISAMADVSFGKWLRILVAVDAIIVLCGGVLTAFVGVGGLMEHMSNDNLLPSLLLYRPKFLKRRSNTSSQEPSSTAPPLIPISFFLLCTLLFVTFQWRHHMAFLSVLGMFTICCMILRVRSDRESCPSSTFGMPLLQKDPKEDDDGGEPGDSVSGLGIILAGCVVVLAIIQIARVAILLVFGSDAVLSRGAIGRTQSCDVNGSVAVNVGLRERLYRWVRESREKPVAYFTNGESLHHLNHVIQHVLHNEPTSRLIIVHCYENKSLIPKSLEANCRVLDHVYPDLRLDLVLVNCRFDASVIPLIAKKLKVQRNLCLVSRPWKNTKHLGDIKGARVILLRR